MKLAQFKTKGSDKQRVGVLMGEVVCDVAELARAVKAAGGEPASWLLEVDGSLEIIKRSPAGVAEIEALFSYDESRADRGATTAFSVEAIEFLPAVYPGKILAIG